MKQTACNTIYTKYLDTIQWHVTSYSERRTVYVVHYTMHTVRRTLYAITVHNTIQYTIHCTWYTVRNISLYIVYNVLQPQCNITQSATYAIQFTMYLVYHILSQFTIIPFTLYNVFQSLRIVYTVRCILYIAHCSAAYNVHYTLYIIVYTAYCTQIFVLLHSNVTAYIDKFVDFQ